MDLKHHERKNITPELRRKNITPELRSCVKVEVAVMGSPSLISLMVSVDVVSRFGIAALRR